MKPKVGQKINHERLGPCIVIKVHPANTIDVQQVGTENYFRITGLSFIKT